jgi:hypothetical protein
MSKFFFTILSHCFSVDGLRFNLRKIHKMSDVFHVYFGISQLCHHLIRGMQLENSAENVHAPLNKFQGLSTRNPMNESSLSCMEYFCEKEKK